MRLGAMLAWAHPGPISMNEFGKPRLSMLLSKDARNSSV